MSRVLSARRLQHGDEHPARLSVRSVADNDCFSPASTRPADGAGCVAGRLKLRCGCPAQALEYYVETLHNPVLATRWDRVKSRVEAVRHVSLLRAQRARYCVDSRLSLNAVPTLQDGRVR